ncbi:MAG: phosphatidate cytidylyltransferase [Bacteroidales bacterium]|nr:phosphatidate cytidylyltransferase [Bacteroidales bacterium]
MNNFSQRIVTGAGYVLVIFLSLITHPIAFILLSGLINLLALLEFRKMDKTLAANRPDWIYVSSVIFTGSLLLSFFLAEDGFNLISILITGVFLFVFGIYKKSEHSWNFIVKSVFSILYISVPLILLNLMHIESDVDSFSIVLILFILNWTNDSFAYVFGLLFGKHRLFERISPKKSWEGFFGGVIMTGIAVYILSFFNNKLEVPEWIILGVLTAISGVFGDFVESVLKRSANVKDSGSLLPGHGGLLDRIDSLLLVSPVIYSYFYIIHLL